MKYLLKCQNCCDQYELEEDEQVGRCPSCGVANARPRVTGEALDKLEMAAELRKKGEFFEAEKYYDFVLLTCKEEHSALWGRLMCQYGVEIIEDPKTGLRYQVLHFARKGKPLQERDDFERACKLAPEAIRDDYEEAAAYIDEAQAEIIRLAEQMEPYDVFICHKTTELDSDEKTDDYKRAKDLYEWLGKLGYRAFFAPEEMQRVSAGANYEAAIFNALHTAKVMLVVCSREDYLNSTWVQSEYRRYLEVMDEKRKENEKQVCCLLPLIYGNMSGNKLPAPFRWRNIQGVTMEDPKAKGIVLEQVKKYCGERGKAVPAPVQVAPEMSSFRAAPVEDGCAIAKYAGPGGCVTVPGVLNGQPVVAIGDGAFEECDALEEVILPPGVIAIGDRAFRACRNLRRVDMPSGMERVGSQAFEGCSSLTRAELPNSVSEMGVQVFGDCTSLTEARIPYHLKELPAYAYRNCTALTMLALQDGVEQIGMGAFHGCASLTAVFLPLGMKRIGRAAFGNCGRLENVYFGDAIQEIGLAAFSGCSEVVLHVDRGSLAFDYAERNGLRVKSGERAEAVSDDDFVTKPCAGGLCVAKYTGKGGRVVIPGLLNGQIVVAIGDGAFENCSTLEAVAVSNAVQSIGASAFHGCTGLKRAALPSGVKEIGNMAFNGCVSLTHIRLPEGLSAVAHYTFFGCSALQTVELPEGLRAIGVGAFHGCTSLQKMDIPQGVKEIGRTAFGECRSLQELTLPEGLQKIERGAFAECSGLVLKVHEGSAAHAFVQKHGLRYEYLRSYAPEEDFVIDPCDDGCSIIKYTGPGGRVVIPPVIRGMPVTEIGMSAFEGCGTLTDVVIPQSVRRLMKRCFRACDGLTRICIPEGVTCICEGILDGCYKLTDVNVPASVKEIRGNPFPRCAVLQAIQVAADNPRYVQCDGVLMSRRGDLICYPAGRQEECYKVPENVEYIGASAFAGCSEMLSVFIPQDAEIHTEAFDRFRCPLLYVYEGSLAHECAQEHGMRFELIEQEKVFRPAPSTDQVVLTITRPVRFAWSLRKVVIRIDGRDEYQLGNGEHVRVELSAGQHCVDLKPKPLTGGNVNWNSGFCLKNIFPTQMNAGQNYTLDLSEWMKKLTV